MNEHMGAGRAGKAGRAALLALACLVPSWCAVVRAADDPKQIVAEAQKRTDARSQRYEGLLQVFDSKGKVSDKRWTLDRIGAHGDSKMVLRFTAPADESSLT